ncbi:hypothetical protein IFM89_028458 [Coptis chinensis]|uniref:Major facilitator superfamily (MFS) profile domain-containing protein n=1 Tax=Coptis chinensis TaxID=261450 RepID=A0A835IQ51_9MAGN|nr:hypothetical protein IFM89_028458 [Coptis chinensis]
MLLGGLVFLVGAISNGAAKNVAMLIVDRLLLGVSVRFSNQSVPLYVSDMVPYKYRGALNNGFQLSITIGILAANIINYFTDNIKGGWGWRVSLAGAGVPTLFIFLGALVLPDTPNSVIERNDPEKAKALLLKVCGTNDVDEEYRDLLAASEASRKVGDPWGKLLKNRKYRPHLTMAILIPFFQQITGIIVIMFCAPVLFKTLGFGNNVSLMSAVITGLVNGAATCVSIYLADRKGRRVCYKLLCKYCTLDMLPLYGSRAVPDPRVRSLKRDRIRGPLGPNSACGADKAVPDPRVQTARVGQVELSWTLMSKASSGIGSVDPRVQTARVGQAELSRTPMSEASSGIGSADPRVQTARVGQAELSRTLVFEASSRIGSADPRVQTVHVGQAERSRTLVSEASRGIGSAGLCVKT